MITKKLKNLSTYWFAWVGLAVCVLGLWASVHLGRWLDIKIIAVMGGVSFGLTGMVFGFLISSQTIAKGWSFFQEDSTVRPKRKTYWKSLIATSIIFSAGMFRPEVTWAYCENVIGSTLLFLIVYTVALAIEYKSGLDDNAYVDKFSPLAIFIGIVSVIQLHPNAIAPVFTYGIAFFIGFLLVYFIVVKVGKVLRRRFDPYTPEEYY